MYTSIEFCDEAAKTALAIPELRASLEEWHGRQAEGKEFEPWLRDIIDYLAANFPDNLEVSAEAMVNALKVQSIGIPSVTAKSEEVKKSFGLDDVDVCFAVEDGIVSVSVWHKGKESEAAAESTKDFLEANGWAADVFKDEECEDEFTVNASRAFDGKEVK